VLIDGHVHVMSADFERYPKRQDAVELPGNRARDHSWQKAAPVTLEDYEQVMDLAGVDRAILTQPFLAYAGDNRYLVDCARGRPDRFVAVGAVDLDKDREPVEVVARLFAADAIAAVRLFVSGPGAGGSLEDPKAFEIAELAGKIGKPVRVHLMRGALSDNAGRLRDLLGQLPGTRFILDACGSPDLKSGAPWPAVQPALELASFKNLSLMVTVNNLLDTDGRAFLAKLVDLFGARRLYWGSSFPHTKGEGYRSLVECAVAACETLNRSDRAQFLGGTVSELFPGLVT